MIYSSTQLRDHNTTMKLYEFRVYKSVHYKTNAQIAKELKITPILDKLLEYKKNWI
jgi:hypothetical protein